MIKDLFRWAARIIELFIATETTTPFGKANLALSFLLAVALVALFAAPDLLGELARSVFDHKPSPFSIESRLIAFAILAGVIFGSLWMLWRESLSKQD